jgi:hypothetical protein
MESFSGGSKSQNIMDDSPSAPPQTSSPGDNSTPPWQLHLSISVPHCRLDPSPPPAPAHGCSCSSSSTRPPVAGGLSLRGTFLFSFVRGHYQGVSTGNNFVLCEIFFAEDKKFALLSQNYRRFGLDEPKAAPALPLTREYRSAVIALSRQTFCICCAEKKACRTRQALTCKQKLDSG